MGEARQRDEWDRHSVLLATIENMTGPTPRVNPKDRDPFRIEEKKAQSELHAAIDRELAAIHLKRTLNRNGTWRK